MSSLRKPASSPIGAHSLGARRSDTESVNLLRWIAIGDEVAFRRFYDATNGLLFGLLLRILGDTEKAEAALSDLYAEIKLNAARYYRQNEGSLTWLFFITHRCALEYLGRSTQTSEPCQTNDLVTSVQPATTNTTEQRRLIRAAIRAIPFANQLKIERAFFYGKTTLEISAELGESPESVEAGIRSGMSQLFSIFKLMRC